MGSGRGDSNERLDGCPDPPPVRALIISLYILV